MTWLYVWRALLLAVSVLCLVMLGQRFWTQRQHWNSKTRDYWYALTMWSLAGFVIAFEGIRQNTAYSVRLVFVSAAALVSLSGLCRKGNWGGKK